MKSRNIVIGQRVKPELLALAKRLRREMTPEEKMLWAELRRNHLQKFHFRRQQVIDGYIADFYCHAAALVVEADGGVHEQQIERDQGRDDILAARGLVILRFKNEEIRHNLNGVLERIAACCHKRAGGDLTP